MGMKSPCGAFAPAGCDRTGLPPRRFPGPTVIIDEAGYGSGQGRDAQCRDTGLEHLQESGMSDTAPTTDESGNSQRRDFLYLATAAMGAVATGAAIWPLIDSMTPAADVRSQSTVSLDLTEVAVGSRITVKWAGKPVFIWRRSPETIAAARTTPLDELVDPVDRTAENPNNSRDMPALDVNRTADEAGEWLVVIGICTHLGCVPLGQDGASVGEFGGW